jgi:predicted nucleic acid-binding protein
MVIVDTGAWLALANRCDRHHEAAVRILANLREQLVTTWPVMTETSHLLVTRLGARALREFLARMSLGAARLFDLDRKHLVRMAELVEKYADLPMDLADASLVVLAEELGSGRIISTDQRDFRAYRWKSRKPFKNLLDLD